MKTKYQRRNNDLKARETAILQAFALVVGLLFLTGCTGLEGLARPFDKLTDARQFRQLNEGGSAEILGGIDDPIVLNANFTSGIYSFEDQHSATMLFWEGPKARPTQVLTVRMIWKPVAGATPLDPNATNATINYIIFADDQSNNRQVGVYSGAGFVYPVSQVGDKKLIVDLEQSTLKLTDRTDSFRDLLGRADIKGLVVAKKNGQATESVIKQFEVIIKDYLGHARSVQSNANRWRPAPRM